MDKLNKKYYRLHQQFHTGREDHLTPLKPLDLNKAKNFADLTDQMSVTAFGGRLVGEAVDTLTQMFKDKDTFVVLTLSGAMTVAKMGLIVTEMIDRGLVQAIVSTGALMAHGLIEGAGMTHFKVPQPIADPELYLKGYDRVYDTLELEKNLDDLEKVIDQIFEDIDPRIVLSSRYLNEKIGKHLSLNIKQRSILKSAYQKGVPVYVPAFSDSELGLDLGLYNRRQIKENKPVRAFNPFLDLEHYTGMIIRQKKLGIFTIGGGVPRNWAQQVGPYIDCIFARDALLDEKTVYSEKNPLMFSYGVRICPEPVEWGGLSGCTYSEGMSWGKFYPPELGGRFSEVLSDATVVWPLMMKAVFEKLGKKSLKKNIFAGKKAVQEVAEVIEKGYGVK